MNPRVMYLEFGILALWTLILAYCTFKGISLNGGMSAAYSAFVAAAAVKVTLS